MRAGNLAGLAAVMTSVVGVIMMVVWQGSAVVVNTGGVLQLLASGMMIVAILRSTWRWVLVMPFLVAAAYLWFVMQGH